MWKQFAALIAIFFAAAAHADVDLTVQTTPLPSRAKTKEKPKPETLHVTLGRTWFRWDDGSASITYDLAARRVVRVAKREHRLDDESLFADVDGRERELENRTMLGKMLEEVKTAENPLALTLAEHQLSMRGGAARPTGIEAQTENGEQRYVWKGNELMAWSSELVAVPARQRDLFVGFIRHRFGGHPQILAELQHLDGIPKQLRFSDGLGESVRIDVSDVAVKPDAPPPAPPSDAKEVVDDPVIAAAVAAAKRVTPQSRDAAVAAVIAAANAAAESKKPLQAMLGYIETTLMLRNDLPPEFAAHRDALLDDPDVQALTTALSANSEETARVAVKTLGRLQLAAGPKGYVVRIFQANTERSLGETGAAMEGLRAALAKNPLLTGVWKDLGDYLAQTYHSDEAWRAYDMARRIAPEHSLLKAVAEKEARLLREHPDLF